MCPGAVRGIICNMPPTPAIVVDPDIQGGTPCFGGTRVPVKSLFDALARGRSVDYFLQQFPSVRAEQVRAVLVEAEQLLRLHSTGSHAA
jgi:uncharacterized protein (DUF433 family)